MALLYLEICFKNIIITKISTTYTVSVAIMIHEINPGARRTNRGTSELGFNFNPFSYGTLKTKHIQYLLLKTLTNNCLVKTVSVCVLAQKNQQSQ